MSQMGTLRYSLVLPALAQSNLTAIAPYMFWLMFRNFASDGFVFDDPVNIGVLSQPGCVLASPSWENTATHLPQDYVYNWTRDAAIIPDQRRAAGLDRPDRRPSPADPGHRAAVRPTRRPHASHGERRDRGEPELPAERLPEPDL